MMDFWDTMKSDLINENIMKKIIVVLLLVIVLFSGCTNSFSFEVGERMSNIKSEHTPYITINALSVYEIKGNYWIVINNTEGIVEKLVEFSPERKSIKVQGLDLIKNEDVNSFLNIDVKELKEKYGQPHVDIGSGFYIPAYITQDAYLICLGLENDVVVEVIKRDLITNDIVGKTQGTVRNH